MMKRQEITVNGKAYPCYPTMGALVRFADITGSEVSEIKSRDLSKLCVYFYCCVVSACAREGVDFPLTREQFCDNIPLEEFNEWQKAISSEEESQEEKKSL